MSRNIEKEYEWQQKKYINFQAKIDREAYQEVYDKAKQDLTIPEFIRRALELYKNNPESFKK